MQIKRRNMWPSECPFLCVFFSFFSFLFHFFFLSGFSRFSKRFPSSLGRNRNDFECYLVWPEISLAAGQGSHRTHDMRHSPGGRGKRWVSSSSRCLGLHLPLPCPVPPSRKWCVIYRQIVLCRGEVLLQCQQPKSDSTDLLMSSSSY